MFVKNLAVEEGDSIELIPEPKWPRIKKAIEALDSDKSTMVCLEAEGGVHMTIGGGPGLCVAYVTFDNETFYRLIDPTRTGDDVQLVVGRVLSQFLPETVVPKEMALQAAKPFAEEGKFDETLNWQDQAHREGTAAEVPMPA